MTYRIGNVDHTTVFDTLAAAEAAGRETPLHRVYDLEIAACGEPGAGALIEREGGGYYLIAWRRDRIVGFLHFS